MNIETKYNIGDKVYIITEGRLYLDTITEIQCSVHEKWSKIVYGFIGATTYYREERECWASRTDFVQESNYKNDTKV